MHAHLDAPPGLFLREGVSLAEELTRMVLGYLGVEGRSEPHGSTPG